MPCLRAGMKTTFRSFGDRSVDLGRKLSCSQYSYRPDLLGSLGLPPRPLWRRSIGQSGSHMIEPTTIRNRFNGGSRAGRDRNRRLDPHSGNWRWGEGTGWGSEVSGHGTGTSPRLDGRFSETPQGSMCIFDHHSAKWDRDLRPFERTNFLLTRSCFGKEPDDPCWYRRSMSDEMFYLFGCWLGRSWRSFTNVPLAELPRWSDLNVVYSATAHEQTKLRVARA